MTDLAKYLLMVLAALVGLALGYTLGHWVGVGDGRELEAAAHNNTAVKESVKAGKQREQIDDETRKMPDADLIRDMRTNGWLRD